MRIDKFLKVSRLIKRREIAKQLCDAGAITINGKIAKPMSEINPGDKIELALGRRIITAQVNEVREFAKKEDAQKMVSIINDISQ